MAAQLFFMRATAAAAARPGAAGVKSAVAARSFSSTNAARAPREKKSQPKLFDKILVANRGEIACRVISTARKLGIQSVAVYSEADANARHVELADEAVCVGPAVSAKSYLNMDAILDAVKKTGAQAVHPGYGFLSENATFIKLLEDNNVVFVGPNSQAVSLMGSKLIGKQTAKDAGVSVVPGHVGAVANEDDAVRIAHEIGYPVMVKAVHGGGGKGMRVARTDAEVREGFRLSKQEAKMSFGSDALLIEKFIDDPHHIEIQVLCDNHGNYLYLPERECSIQRRNQKLIEEAPSPHLDPATRREMGRQAAALAARVKYNSAGTVEFLVDGQRNFYYLEMNTRLQVEHPITEYITGLDLVEQMIRVAAGQRLAFRQEDIKINGWAMETRLNAEDPFRKFLPSIGRLVRYQEPEGAAHFDISRPLRVDAGVQEGSEISTYYDSLIAKVVTHAKTRDAAIDAMEHALDRYVVRGLNHNASFLRSVMSHPRFREGRLSTNFIPEEYPQGFTAPAPTDEQRMQLIATAAVLHQTRAHRAASHNQTLGHWEAETEGEWMVRLLGTSLAVRLQLHDENDSEEGHGGATVEIFDKPEHYTEDEAEQDEDDAAADNTPPPTEVTLRYQSFGTPLDPLIFFAEINGKETAIQITNVSATSYRLTMAGCEFDVEVLAPHIAEYSHHMPAPPKINFGDFCRSPMPGSIASVAVKEGDRIVMGQELVVVEAMKMQNILRSERDGVVKKVHVKPGQDVAVDQTLVEFEPEAAAATTA